MRRGAVAVAAAFAIGVAPAGAATIEVETKKDEFGAGGTKKCALREAVQAANENARFGGCKKGKGADVIKLGRGTYNLTIPGTAEDENADGDIDTLASLRIVGKGMGKTAIDANGATKTGERAIHQLGGALAIQRLTVRAGHDLTSDGGGAIYNQGGKGTALKRARLIHNLSAGGSGGGLNVDEDGTGRVLVDRSQILENDAYDYGGGLATYHDGDFIVKRSLIAGNAGDTGPGGILANQTGAFELVDSKVLENVAAEYGGGIEIDGGSTLIKRSTIAGNSVAEKSYYGAGIYDEGNEGTARVVDSTISGNVVGDGYGGGLYLHNGTWKIVNSTISRNTSGYFDNGRGGGIYNDGAVVMVTNSTITRNFAYDGYGGVENFGDGTLELRNTLLANNRAYFYESDYDCNGATSLGHNLIGDGSCSPLASDLVGASGEEPLDPRIGALLANGGPTRTHALLSGSPAINKAHKPSCPKRDQRGKKRKGKCDIGAFER